LNVPHDLPEFAAAQESGNGPEAADAIDLFRTFLLAKSNRDRQGGAVAPAITHLRHASLRA
jgi:hypothetical protein